MDTDKHRYCRGRGLTRWVGQPSLTTPSHLRSSESICGFICSLKPRLLQRKEFFKKRWRKGSGCGCAWLSRAVFISIHRWFPECDECDEMNWTFCEPSANGVSLCGAKRAWQVLQEPL